VTHPLDCFANPKSIAVIGASTVPHKAGGRRWRSMVDAGFPGPLYPIHPSATEVLGHRAYRSLGELPGPVDLAVVLVRPDLVPATIAECADRRVPAVVVITAGFGETGPAGKAVEREMVARLRQGGGRMIGPNCAGLFSASGRVNALGWAAPPGPIAVISQSGNMALTFVQFAREKGLGFSKLITVGNAADIRIPEYVEYLLDDPDTRVIVAYLEGFEPSEGRDLVELLGRHPAPKPLVILKPGETESGRRAALSHTGALAGRHRVVKAALRQAGAIQVRDSEEAWDAAMALALLPPLRPPSVAVISDGGGHATIVCDAADRAGLLVPPLGAATREALAQILPARSAIGNPVDFAGLAEEEPEAVPRALDACLGDPDIGGAILAGHFGGYFKIATPELGQREVAAAAGVARVVARHGKPFALHTIYGGEGLPALEVLRGAGVPVYRSLEAVARAMAALGRASVARPAPPRMTIANAPDPGRVAAVLGRAVGSGPRLLLEPDARELMTLYGVPVPAWRVTTTPAETAAAARELGGPVALKAVSADVVHKSDAGLVLLDVDGPAAAVQGHEELVRRASRVTGDPIRVLVSSMIRGGIEIVAGAFRDVQFGPVVMVGLGGVLVEALDDVVFRLAPVDEAEAQAMLGELRARRLLTGMRGRPAADLRALARVVAAVSVLAAHRPEIAELDLNPVFALPAGAAVADARVVLG
jgi:acyl-CoA synthetase (NDP forming)